MTTLKQFMPKILIPAVMGAAMMLNSCGKDKESPEVIDPLVASISAKWEIADPESRYASFEFLTDGSYVVQEYAGGVSKSSRFTVKSGVSLEGFNLKANPFFSKIKTVAQPKKAKANAETKELTIHVGKYTFKDDVILLANLGVISKFAVDADEFQFSFTPEGGVTVEFVGVKADEVDASDRTTLLCRTWIANKAQYDFSNMKLSDEDIEMLELFYGANWQEMIQLMADGLLHLEINGEVLSLCVLFSKAGTYLSLFKDSKGNIYTEIVDEDGFYTISSGMGHWEWGNATQTTLKITDPEEWGEPNTDIIEVVELNKKIFKIKFVDEEMGISVIEEYVREK